MTHVLPPDAGLEPEYERLDHWWEGTQRILTAYGWLCHGDHHPWRAWWERRRESGTHVQLLGAQDPVEDEVQLLIIEDAHELDWRAPEVPSHTKVLLIGAERPGEHFALEPLSTAELHARLSAHVPTSTADTMLATLSGRPLTPDELHRFLDAQTRHGPDVEIRHILGRPPATLQGRWERLCEDLPTQRLLTRMCVYRAPIPREQLSFLCHLGLPELDAVLKALLEDGAVHTHEGGYAVHETLRQWLGARPEPDMHDWVEAVTREARQTLTRWHDTAHVQRWAPHLEVLRWALERPLELETHAAIATLYRLLEPHDDVLDEMTARALEAPLREETARFLHIQVQQHLRRSNTTFARRILSHLHTELSEDGGWQSAVLAYVLSSLGVLEISLGQMEASRRWLDHALEVELPLQDHIHATVLRAQGLWAYERTEFARAHELWGQAHQHAQHTQDIELRCKILFHLAELNVDIGDHQMSHAWLDAGTDLSQQAGPMLLGYNHHTAGLIYLRTGHPERAQESFRAAGDLFEALDRQTISTVSRSNEALAWMHIGDVECALEAITSASRLSEGAPEQIATGVAIRHCWLQLLAGLYQQAYLTYSLRLKPRNTRQRDDKHAFLMCVMEFHLALLPETRNEDMLHPSVTLRRLTSWADDDHILSTQCQLLSLLLAWEQGEDSLLEWVAMAQEHDPTKSPSLRLLRRFLEQRLAEPARSIWRMMCRGEHADAWWLCGALIRSPAGAWLELNPDSQLGTIVRLVCASPEGVDSQTLIEQLWPDDEVRLEQGRNRVYVMIAKLRKKGITFVVHQDGSYQVDPEQRVHVVDTQS